MVSRPNWRAMHTLAIDRRIVDMKPGICPGREPCLTLERMGRPAGSHTALSCILFWLVSPLAYPSTWQVGLRPCINAATRICCGTCVQVCPLPEVSDLEILRIDAQASQRG